MGADPAGAGLAVRLLGPVEIGRAGGVIAPVAQPQQRVLLGLLGVAAGRMVSAEALVDGVWGEEWSPRREQNLHALVYQLRRRLAALEPGAAPGRGEGRLARAGGGYQLALAAGELDVGVFQDLAGRGPGGGAGRGHRGGAGARSAPRMEWLLHPAGDTPGAIRDFNMSWPRISVTSNQSR
jgi:hypothetical protein